MPSPIRAVIFDSDGTLVDSETLSMAVLVEYVAELGLTIPFSEALERFAGGELPKVFGEIQTRLDSPLPPDHLDQFRSRQLARLATDVEAIPGADELLASLSVPFCVASNAPRNKVQLCLETTGLSRHFDSSRVFSAYEVNAWKPAPDLFLTAAEALGFAPADCAVIEDSEFGVAAGLAAGMQVFAYDPHQRLKVRESVRSVGSLTDLVSILG